MTTKYQPLGDYVLLKHSLAEKSKGGVLLPEKERKMMAQATGVVIAKGPKVEGPINVGDTVLLQQYQDGGQILDLDGQKGAGVLVREKGIIAKVNEETEVEEKTRPLELD